MNKIEQQIVQMKSFIATQAKAGAIMWEVMGRALCETSGGICPRVARSIFELQGFDRWCGDCRSSDTITRAGAGDEHHKTWRCWSSWIGENMKPGKRFDISRYA